MRCITPTGFLRALQSLGLLLQAWSALASLEQLLVDHNALTGNLPGSYQALTNLRILTLGETEALAHAPSKPFAPGRVTEVLSDFHCPSCWARRQHKPGRAAAARLG